MPLNCLFSKCSPLIFIFLWEIFLREPNLTGIFPDRSFQCDNVSDFPKRLQTASPKPKQQLVWDRSQGLIHIAVDLEQYHPFLMGITLIATLPLWCAVCFCAIIICESQWVKTFDKTFENYFRRASSSRFCVKLLLPPRSFQQSRLLDIWCLCVWKKRKISHEESP